MGNLFSFLPSSSIFEHQRHGTLHVSRKIHSEASKTPAPANPGFLPAVFILVKTIENNKCPCREKGISCPQSSDWSFFLEKGISCPQSSDWSFFWLEILNRGHSRTASACRSSYDSWQLRSNIPPGLSSPLVYRRPTQRRTTPMSLSSGERYTRTGTSDQRPLEKTWKPRGRLDGVFLVAELLDFSVALKLQHILQGS